MITRPKSGESMPSPSVTYTFSNSTTADATQVNQNFTDLINGLSDGTKDLSVSAITAAGNVTFNGNTAIGNASGDTLTITASLASTVSIGTTFSYDIGSSTIGLKDVYFGSIDSAAKTTKIRAGTVATSNTVTLPITTCALAGAASASPLTSGSVPYANASGLLTEDGSLHYWDATNHALGVGAAPANTYEKLHVTTSSTSTGSSAPAARIYNSDGTNTGDVALTLSVAAQNWFIGIDNSASDAFKIGPGSTWDSAPAITISTGKLVEATSQFYAGVTSAPDCRHHIKNNSTSNQTLLIQNGDTTSSSDAIYGINITKGSTTTTGSQRFIIFNTNAGAGDSGYIGANGASNAALYATSDRRMKKNIVDLDVDALSKIMSLRPRKFKWKKNDEDAHGFVAQELAEVFPQFVVKSDDGLGDAPQGEPWAMTESGFVPYLVKAIQQLGEKVAALEDKVAKLEAKGKP